MTGGREPLSRPSSRHGEARRPLTLTCPCCNVARAASEIANTKDRTLNGGGDNSVCLCRRKGGACRLSWPAHGQLAAGGRVRAGPPRRTPRPQERAGTVRGTVRATSPAHFPRVPDRHPYGPRPWAWFAKRIEQVARRAAPRMLVQSCSSATPATGVGSSQGSADFPRHQRCRAPRLRLHRRCHRRPAASFSNHSPDSKPVP